MFKIFKEVKDSIKTIEDITSENRLMTNPFSKVVNQTFVWTEKPELFKKILKYAHLAIKKQPIDFSNGRFVLSEILKP